MSFPLEIWLMILEYVDTKTLKTFSECNVYFETLVYTFMENMSDDQATKRRYALVHLNKFPLIDWFDFAHPRFFEMFCKRPHCHTRRTTNNTAKYLIGSVWGKPE